MLTVPIPFVPIRHIMPKVWIIVPIPIVPNAFWAKILGIYGFFWIGINVLGTKGIWPKKCLFRHEIDGTKN